MTSRSSIRSCSAQRSWQNDSHRRTCLLARPTRWKRSAPTRSPFLAYAYDAFVRPVRAWLRNRFSSPTSATGNAVFTAYAYDPARPRVTGILPVFRMIRKIGVSPQEYT